MDHQSLGFSGVDPIATGRPAYHPTVLLKLYIYGYLNRIQSSRRLEREAQRNVELMWLTGRLAPDFKTIADFRSNNGRSEEHTSELQSLMRNSYAVFCLKTKIGLRFSQTIHIEPSPPTN